MLQDVLGKIWIADGHFQEEILQADFNELDTAHC